MHRSLQSTGDVRPAAEEDQGLPPRERLWVMSAVLMGFMLINLDGSIANLALPTLAREFSASNAATVWVVNVYQLAMAVCLLPSAALGAKFGLRPVYATGIAAFTLASIGCAMSSSLPMLVAMRVLQAVGGSCVVSLGPALVRVIHPPKMMARGMATVAMVIALSSVLGPTLSAVILSVATWPWLFLINAPICLTALAIFLLKAPRLPGHGRRFDWMGSALSAAALGLVVVGVGHLGDARTLGVGLMLAGLVFVGLLFAHQRLRPHPMLPLDLLRVPLFSLSMGTSSCSYCAQILVLIAMPFLLQGVMHRTAVATGLLITAWPIMVVFSAPLAGRLIGRFPPPWVGTAGMAIMTLGLALLAMMPERPADWDIAWRMGICGVGFGLYQTPNNMVILTAGPLHRNAEASAMLAVARLVGWAVGSAMAALFLAGPMAVAVKACLVSAAVISGLGVLIGASRAPFARRI